MSSRMKTNFKKSVSVEITPDTLTFLVELSSVDYCTVSKIRGYRSMLQGSPHIVKTGRPDLSLDFRAK